MEPNEDATSTDTPIEAETAERPAAGVRIHKRLEHGGGTTTGATANATNTDPRAAAVLVLPSLPSTLSASAQKCGHESTCTAFGDCSMARHLATADYAEASKGERTLCAVRAWQTERFGSILLRLAVPRDAEVSLDLTDDSTS